MQLWVVFWMQLWLDGSRCSSECSSRCSSGCSSGWLALDAALDATRCSSRCRSASSSRYSILDAALEGGTGCSPGSSSCGGSSFADALEAAVRKQDWKAGSTCGWMGAQWCQWFHLVPLACPGPAALPRLASARLVSSTSCACDTIPEDPRM